MLFPNGDSYEPILKFMKLDERAVIPTYQTAGAAGMDLVAIKHHRISLMERVAVDTGLAIALKPGWEAQVRPRSGLAIKHGITVLNAPGTIDCDYRGEISVILINLGNKVFEVQPGDRIAQLVIAQAPQIHYRVVDVLDQTERGAGGFGSTGIATA